MTSKTIVVCGPGSVAGEQAVEIDAAACATVQTMRSLGFRVVVWDSNPHALLTDQRTADAVYFAPPTDVAFQQLLDREQPAYVWIRDASPTAREAVGRVLVQRERATVQVIDELKQLGTVAANAPNADVENVTGTSPVSLAVLIDSTSPARWWSAVHLIRGFAEEGVQVLAIANRAVTPMWGLPTGTQVLVSETVPSKIVEHCKAASITRLITQFGPTLPDGFEPALADQHIEIVGTAQQDLRGNPRPTESFGDVSRTLGDVTVLVDVVRASDGSIELGPLVQQIEHPGIHAKDAAWVTPPISVQSPARERIIDLSEFVARAMRLVGVMTIRFGVTGRAVSMVDLTPGPSDNVPFIDKSKSIDLAALAAKALLGKHLSRDLFVDAPGYAVREAVFAHAAGDPLLTNATKSTGSVMTMGQTIASAFAQSQFAAGLNLHTAGAAIISAQDEDNPAVVDLVRRLQRLSMRVLAVGSTWGYLQRKYIECESTNEAEVLSLLAQRRVSLVISTDPKQLQTARQHAQNNGVSYYTTAEAARLAVLALEQLSPVILSTATSAAVTAAPSASKDQRS